MYKNIKNTQADGFCLVPETVAVAVRKLGYCISPAALALWVAAKLRLRLAAMAVASNCNHSKLLAFSKTDLLSFTTTSSCRHSNPRCFRIHLFCRLNPPPTLPELKLKSRLRTVYPQKNSKAPNFLCRAKESDSADANNEDAAEADDGSTEEDSTSANARFWDSSEGQERFKDLEDMRDLVREAEKLHENDSIAQKSSSVDDEDEESRRERIREQLAKRAKEQAEKRKTAEIMFKSGQRAYGKGMYQKSIELLETALENVSKDSLFGGEIQLWLAMAYDAQNRHNDSIALYKTLEATHPIAGIRKQAAELRYILEAPRLKITQEEMVTIPLLSPNYERSRNSWSQRYSKRMRKSAVSGDNKASRDYLSDFFVWKRPQWERSPYFWVAVAMWLTLVGVALIFQD